MNLQHKQKGVVGILVVVGLVALLAMAGLALDSGHAMLNKTRLQNAVDAAALSGAKELDLTGGDVFLARALL
jgi:Flp pilus assembly protein TadG